MTIPNSQYVLHFYPSGHEIERLVNVANYSVVTADCESYTTFTNPTNKTKTLIFDKARQMYKMCVGSHVLEGVLHDIRARDAMIATGENPDVRYHSLRKDWQKQNPVRMARIKLNPSAIEPHELTRVTPA